MSAFCAVLHVFLCGVLHDVLTVTLGSSVHAAVTHRPSICFKDGRCWCNLSSPCLALGHKSPSHLGVKENLHNKSHQTGMDSRASELSELSWFAFLQHVDKVKDGGSCQRTSWFHFYKACYQVLSCQNCGGCAFIVAKLTDQNILINCMTLGINICFPTH